MTNKLSAARRAKQDQILAAAKTQSIEEDAAVTVVVDIDGTTRCSWCDCPLADHSGGATPDTCQGCHRLASHTIHQYRPGGDYRGNVSVCEFHLGDFTDCYHHMHPAAEVVLYDPHPWRPAPPTN